MGVKLAFVMNMYVHVYGWLLLKGFYVAVQRGGSRIMITLLSIKAANKNRLCHCIKLHFT